VMIGRAAYDDPYLFATVDSAFFGATTPVPSRREVVAALVPYVEERLASGIPLHRLTRHLHGLFAHQPGARAWRRWLSVHGCRPGAGVDVLLDALEQVPGTP